MGPSRVLRAVIVVAAGGILLSGMAGCGTVLNFSMGVSQPGAELAGTEIYGGLQVDAQMVGKAFEGYQPWWFNVFAFLFVFDIPLSLVADTITLPITIPIALSRE